MCTHIHLRTITSFLPTRLVPLCLQVKDEKEALRKALSGSKKTGTLSWLEIYRVIAEAVNADDLCSLKLDFDLMIDFATGFHTLTPITDILYTARLEKRLRRSSMVLDLALICHR